MGCCCCGGDLVVSVHSFYHNNHNSNPVQKNKIEQKEGKVGPQ